MKILVFSEEYSEYLYQAAELLAKAFPHAYGNYEGEAMEELQDILADDGFLMMAIEAGEVRGFAGAIPQYGVTGWELHPLVVKKAEHQRGIGRQLVAALEAEIVRRGGIMVYLGTDDEFFATSLSQGDLFENTFEKIQHIRNLKGHPFEFYQKVGYQIVGVLPDANGLGKPDIFMAKRLIPFGNPNP